MNRPDDITDLSALREGGEFLVLTHEYTDQAREVLGWQDVDAVQLQRMTLGALRRGARVLTGERGPNQDVLFVAVSFNSRTGGRRPALLELHRTGRPSPNGEQTITYACRAEAIGAPER